MNNTTYQSMENRFNVRRRDFLKIGGAIGSGVVLGTPWLWAQDKEKKKKVEKVKTNVEEVLNIPKTRHSLPGHLPGKVVEVHDSQAMKDEKPNMEVIRDMFNRGLTRLTSKDQQESFNLFFDKDDVVGIKVNPVGAGLINTRLEVVEVTIDWLNRSGIPLNNIVIWDRFDFMLKEAGYTTDRFPGIDIIGLQTMDEKAMETEYEDNSKWLTEDGKHISAGNFDKSLYYWADVEGPKDLPYLHQHVFNGKYSYFGKLLTQRLTKIINIPVFKNSGNGISMATKNMGYGSICNTNRLHRPLYFDVNVEVMAFPVIRDKLVLNILDGLRAQYDGGPMPNAQFTYLYNRLFFATDAFALDRIGHQLMLEKRKEMGVKVNEHPMYTEYFKYAQNIGLGVTDRKKIEYDQI